MKNAISSSQDTKQIITPSSTVSHQQPLKSASSQKSFIENYLQNKHLYYKMLTAVGTVLISSQITAYFMLKPKLQNRNNPDELMRVRALKSLTNKIIRFDSIAFSAKLYLDNYYKEQIQKNQAYYQQNCKIYYKIGALTGLILYLLNIPLMELEKPISGIRAFQYANKGVSRYSPIRVVDGIRQFFSVNSLKNMASNVSILGFTGSIIYRTLYFGGYERLRKVSQNPINRYFLAPFGASLLGMLVLPLDNLRFAQHFQSNKDKSIYDIVSSKQYKVWNLSTEASLSRIAKQSLSLSLFVLGQSFYDIFVKGTYVH